MNHRQEEVASTFNKAAAAYDRQRRQLIPCFDDFYGIAAAVAESESGTPSILDLGAGTGLMSSFMLRKYPNARLTLIDISGQMLETARSRFAQTPNVAFIVDDYTHFVSENEFDIVVSALSIHHLDDAGKKLVYKNAFRNLRRGGVFVNADQVLGSTAYLESLYKSDWKRKVETSGLPKEDILAAYERTKLDHMSTLDDQLAWLKEIGFSDVDCVYKYYNFVVMLGRKM